MSDFLAFLPALGSAIANVGSSIATNNTNKKISRETNAQNYQIWQEQLAAQREQYEKEKQENRFLVQQQRDWSLADRDFENNYNSPSNVRQRLIDAGINPAFAMANGQGLFGSATAETSTGSPPTSSIPAAPEMHGYTVDYSGFGRGLSDIMAGYYQAKADERADYQLASDITLRDKKLQIDFLMAETAARKAKVDEDVLEQRRNEFDKTLTFEKEKSDRDFSLREDHLALQADTLVLDAVKTNIQRALVESQIRLSKSQIASIGQSIAESVARVNQMIHDQKLSEDEAIHRVFEDMIHDKQKNRELELLEKQTDANFVKNLITSAVAILPFGAAAGAGYKWYKGYKSARTTKRVMNRYSSDPDTF